MRTKYDPAGNVHFVENSHPKNKHPGCADTFTISNRDPYFSYNVSKFCCLHEPDLMIELAQRCEKEAMHENEYEQSFRCVAAVIRDTVGWTAGGGKVSEKFLHILREKHELPQLTLEMTN